MMGISKSGSIKGYSLNIWLKRNKESLKLLFSGLMGVAAFFAAKVLPVEVQSGVAGVVAVVTKLGLDAADFYLSDVKLE